MFQLVITPSAKRSVKKLSKVLRKEIIKQTQALKQNPYLGEKLSALSIFYILFISNLKAKNIGWLIPLILLKS